MCKDLTWWRKTNSNITIRAAARGSICKLGPLDVTNITVVEMDHGGKRGTSGNGIVLTTITISPIVSSTYMEPQGEVNQPTDPIVHRLTNQV